MRLERAGRPSAIANREPPEESRKAAGDDARAARVQHPFTALLLSRGIRHRLTALCTPQTNGVAERFVIVSAVSSPLPEGRGGR